MQLLDVQVETSKLLKQVMSTNRQLQDRNDELSLMCQLLFSFVYNTLDTDENFGCDLCTYWDEEKDQCYNHDRQCNNYISEYCVPGICRKLIGTSYYLEEDSAYLSISLEHLKKDFKMLKKMRLRRDDND